MELAEGQGRLRNLDKVPEQATSRAGQHSYPAQTGIHVFPLTSFSTFQEDQTSVEAGVLGCDRKLENV